LLPVNDGLWNLRVSAGVARVSRSERRPDLTLATRELAASYLGGTSLNAIHRAGLVEEHTAGSVAALSAAFSWPIPPFCPDNF